MILLQEKIKVAIRGQTSIRITGAVYNAINDNYAWGPGIRNCYIIHYVKSGRGYFECMGRTYTLTEGQCFMIFPNTQVRYYPDKDDPWTYCWINFSGYDAPKAVRNCSFSPDRPVTEFRDREAEHFFEEAAGNIKSSEPYDIYKNIACFYSLLAFLIKKAPSNISLAKTKNQKKIITEAAISYIESNYQNPELNTESVAQEIKTSRSTLYRAFMRDLSCPPTEYIEKIRIENAKALLKYSSHSIKSIAYLTGFSSPVYFSQMFKRSVGVSPKEYRKQF